MVGKISSPAVTAPKPLGESRLPSTGGSTGSAQASIGATQISAGQQIQRAAEEYFKETDAVFKDGQYNTAILGAQKEFNEAYNKRLMQIKDANGNVNIKDIPADIDKLSADILAKHTANILDGGVSQRVSGQFQSFTLNKGLEAMNRAAALQEEYAKNSALDGIEYNLTMAENADNPEQASTYLAAAREQGLSGAANGYLNGRSFSAKIAGAEKKIYKQIAENSFYKSLNAGDVKGAAAQIDKMPVDEETKYQYHVKINTIEKAAKAEVTTAAKSNLVDSKQTITDGGYVSDEQIAKNREMAVKVPELAEDFKKVEDKNFISKTLNFADNATRNQKALEMQNDPNISPENKKLARDIKSSIDTRINADPVGFTLANNPQVQVIPLDPKSNDFQAALLSRQNLKGTIQNATGKSNVLGTKSELEGIVNYYQEANIDDKVKLAGTISGTLGSDATTLFKQIKENGGESLAAIGELVNQGRPLVAQKALKGAELRAKDGKIVEIAKEKEFYSAVETETLPISANPQQTLNNQRLARDVFNYNMIQAGLTTAEFDDPTVQKIYSDSIKSVIGGEPIDFGNDNSMWTRNDKANLITPPKPGVTATKFDSWVDQLDITDIVKVGGVSGITTGEFLDNLKNREYSLRDAGTGKYAVLRTLEDGSSIFVTNSKGKVFILDYDKINE